MVSDFGLEVKIAPFMCMSNEEMVKNTKDVSQTIRNWGRWIEYWCHNFERKLTGSHFCACTLEIQPKVVQNVSTLPKFQFFHMKSMPLRKMVMSDFRLEVEIAPLLHICNKKMVKNTKNVTEIHFLCFGPFCLSSFLGNQVAELNDDVRIWWCQNCDRKFTNSSENAMKNCPQCCVRQVSPMCHPMWACWRHLANMIELVLPSAHPSPQPKW